MIVCEVQARATACVQTTADREAQQPTRSLNSKNFAHPSSYPSPAALPSLLKQCGKAKALDDGKLLHSHICKYLDVHDTFLGNCLVEMYGDCSDVLDAACTFSNIAELNLFSWNILINAFARNGYVCEAVDAYHDMQHRGFAPNSRTFVCVLNAFSSTATLKDVWEIHSVIINNGYIGHTIVCTALLTVYSRSQNLSFANVIFEHIPHKDVVAWNAMLAACTENGCFQEALHLFHHMEQEGFQPNHVTYTCALDVCASLGSIKEARKVYELVLTSGYIENQIVGNALLNMFGKCGSLVNAEKLFSQMPHLDLFSWSTMIAACAQNGNEEAGLDLFYEMQCKGIEPNAVTFACAINACARKEVLGDAKKIHSLAAKSRFAQDIAVVNALITMYGKCKSPQDARSVFDHANKLNVATWNVMMSAYAENGLYKEVLEIFKEMQSSDIKPDHITFIYSLEACACLANLEEGQIISDIVGGSEHQNDIMVNTALINMYGKCGDIKSLKITFDRMTEWDAVVWSSVIAAFSYNGLNENALDLFHQTRNNSVVPDSITFVCALNACSSLACLKEGLEIHLDIVKMGYEQELQVTTALVETYGKCGSLESARAVFIKMLQKDVVAWNSMMAACAQNGKGEEAISLFYDMQQARVKPNTITFVNVLSACNHIGSVEDGSRIFALVKDHGIEYSAEHCLYMIDLFGRMGLTNDADALIGALPFGKTGKLWHSLLGACGGHDDLEHASRIARHAIQADPENPAPYVLLSNLYAADKANLVQAGHG